jgi:HSP20 family molecular chaperone IbpA
MGSQIKTPAGAEQEAFLELPRKMAHGGRSAPRIDAVEADGMIEMIAEVPGVPESAIDVTLEGDVLTIEVDKGNGNEGKRAHFAERVFGHFRRSIQMPFAPDPAEVRAALKDGLLTISFPRAEQRRKHRVEVRAAPRETMGQGSAIGSDWAEHRGSPTEPLTLDIKASPSAPVRGR